MWLLFDRDLKPTNVLLDEDDRPVLMDLGSMNRARIEVNAQGLLRISEILPITLNTLMLFIKHQSLQSV